MSSDVQSLGGSFWRKRSVSDRISEMISQKYDLPLLVSKIIVSRGIDVEKIPDFLEPKLQNILPNPTVLKDMDIASKRIADAVLKKEKVGIIGDYDVDGATSSSVMKLFLEALGLEVFIHIPERIEGYGPSILAFDKFSAMGIELVITTDCGTSAFEPFLYAKEKNIQVIVIDHHEAEVSLPDVLAIVNPQRLDENEEAKSLRTLAAVGVVFMVVIAINRELRERNFYKDIKEPNLMQFLDLVALGTVCDVVPLSGLNRAFVVQGLKVIANRTNLGLKTLIDKVGINEMPNTYHLGYVLGPRINAGGRVGESYKASELLSSRNPSRVEELAVDLCEFNQKRKEIEDFVLLNAIEQLESVPQKYSMVFVFDKNWHQGVIGIVAGRLKERYDLPAFVMSIEDDEVKGSSRSIEGVDLGALIISAKEKGILTKGGGHMMAAGFSLSEDKIEEFRSFIGEHLLKKLGSEKIAPTIEFDEYLDILGVNIELVDKLSILEPYGAGNSEPKFVLKNIRLRSSFVVGSGHIKCVFTSMKGGRLEAMGFRLADSEKGKALLSGVGNAFEVLGVLRKNVWQGRATIQFIIEDIRKVS